ncbi:MAG: hypothetical protein U9N43_09205 [Euryarchaeota archaeon]|nr:hypothetical protein [Euryarchaeota archaeon]
MRRKDLPPVYPDAGHIAEYVTLAAVALDSWQLTERLRSTTAGRTLSESDTP